MNLLFARHFGLTILLLCVFAGSGWYTYSYYMPKDTEVIDTATVSLIDITQTIVVSGKTEARQIATLSFPVSGIIQQIYPNIGDTVQTGDIIASLTKDALVAEYDVALENVRYLEEIKQELLRGPVETERAVARQNVQIAEARITQLETDYTQVIKNARRNLLSTGLAAYPTVAQNNTVPPIISGNYLCNEEGTYQLYVYRSSASSDYSYVLSNRETGTFVANIDSATPLGSCGLYIQFASDEQYHNTTWTIDIPNKRSPQYVTLKNNYDQLVTEKSTALSTARENITLAQRTEQALITPTSAEVINQAEANLSAAKAQLAVQEAVIADFTIKAPFTGVVSTIDMKIGETTGPNQTIKMVYEGDYQLKARIPEIDITRLKAGNLASVIFDADSSRSFPAEVTYISPLSTELSGVAYYEAEIKLKESPTWLREGLNADITIEQMKLLQVPSLPRRYIKFENQSASVLISASSGTEVKTITTGIIGTDGQTQVMDLPVGTTVLLP